MESRHGVYILVNSETKGIVKIGMTTRHVDDRIAELHGTGTIGRFSCVGFIRTDSNPEILERKLHSAFQSVRVNNEFFRVSPETVYLKALEFMTEYDAVALKPADVKRAEVEREYARYQSQLSEASDRLQRESKERQESTHRYYLDKAKGIHGNFEWLLKLEKRHPMWRKGQPSWSILYNRRKYGDSEIQTIKRLRRELSITDAHSADKYTKSEYGIKLKCL